MSSPALTNGAVALLQDNLNEEERQLWTSLGPNWTLPRSDVHFSELANECNLGAGKGIPALPLKPSVGVGTDAGMGSTNELSTRVYVSGDADTPLAPAPSSEGR